MNNLLTIKELAISAKEKLKEDQVEDAFFQILDALEVAVKDIIALEESSKQDGH